MNPTSLSELVNGSLIKIIPGLPLTGLHDPFCVVSILYPLDGVVKTFRVRYLPFGSHYFGSDLHVPFLIPLDKGKISYSGSI